MYVRLASLGDLFFAPSMMWDVCLLANYLYLSADFSQFIIFYYYYCYYLYISLSLSHTKGREAGGINISANQCRSSVELRLLISGGMSGVAEKT